MADLAGKKVAVLVDNYFEEAEFTEPIEALKKAGAEVTVVAAEPDNGQVQAMNHAELSDKYPIDQTLEETNFEEFDALVLPGGAINADQLRVQDKAKQWVKSFMDAGKPLAVICHAPWVLASAGVAKGRKLTSFFTIKDDMKLAGADWVDEEVVVDGNLITSRKPDDIPAFNQALISMMGA